MAKVLAYCGLDCGKCEAYIATKNNDPEALQETARKWAERFGANNIRADMCVCDGCHSGGRLSTVHAATCTIRLCASRRGVTTCAHCRNYVCAILQHYFRFAPVLREKLAIVRQEIDKDEIEKQKIDK